MIKLFKINNPLNYSIVFVIMLVLWAYRFSFAPTPIEGYNLDSLFMSAQFENHYYKLLSPLIAYIILYLFSLIIVKINSDLAIVENAYQMPALLFVILTGFYINSQRFFISIIAGILFFLSISTLCYADKLDKTYSGCYNAGLLFCVSALLYPKLIILFPLLFITLIIIRSVEWREIVILLMGTATPIVILGSLIYLYADLNYVISELYSNFKQMFITKYEYFFFISFVPIIIWGLISIFSELVIKNKLSLKTRNLQLVFTIYILSLLVFLASPFSDKESIVIIFAPISILLSNFFINTKTKISNIFFYILILNVVACQIFQIIFYQSIY